MTQDETKENFKELIANLQETIGACHLTTGTTQCGQLKNTMAACKVRFSGQNHREAVAEFINGVETFKSLEQIDDEDALKGISLLFTGTASIWWQGVRKEANTWQECLQLIREHFAPSKPPHQLYMEIFAVKQDDQTSISLFIIQKRALLAQLPEGRHDEQVQLDLIYGLIHFKYRQYMKREDVRTFHELLQKGRDIEQIYVEAASSGEKVKAKRCSYCNYRGHTSEECRRRQQKQQPHMTESKESNKGEGEGEGKKRP